MAAHPLEAWRDFFVMIGSSAGALVGLLFVVMSLHLGSIVERSDANMRATIDGSRNNTFHLLTVLVEAALLLAPQPILWLAVELVVVNLYGLRLPVGMVLKYARRGLTISERGGFPFAPIVTIFAAYVLGAAGSVMLTQSVEVAMYMIAASCVAKVVRSVLTAWMLMFGVLQREAQKPHG